MIIKLIVIEQQSKDFYFMEFGLIKRNQKKPKKQKQEAHGGTSITLTIAIIKSTIRSHMQNVCTM